MEIVLSMKIDQICLSTKKNLFSFLFFKNQEI